MEEDVCSYCGDPVEDGSDICHECYVEVVEWDNYPLAAWARENVHW